MLDWNELKTRIDAAQSVLLTTHVRPDGDALGSELAFAELLEQRGKRATILNASPTPPRYYFLDPGCRRIQWIHPGESPHPQITPDLLVVLDTGTWSQLAGLADYVRSLTCPKVVIDHHVSQDDLGALRLVDVSAAATGVLVHRAFRELDGVVTPSAARALFVAVAMDTGWMRHPNATSNVFEVAAELVARGAKPHEIYRELFEQNRVERLKLLRVLYDHVELRAGGRLATSRIAWSEIAEVGAHPMETEDFINELMTIQGVEVAVLFIGQSDGGAKVSFRSRTEFDCSALAESFGGGGHRAAAGATLKAPLEEARRAVLPRAERLLAESANQAGDTS